MNEADVDAFLTNLRFFRANSSQLVELLQGSNRKDRRHARQQLANNAQLQADLVQTMKTLVDLADDAVLVVNYLRHRPAGDEGAGLI